MTYKDPQEKSEEGEGKAQHCTTLKKGDHSRKRERNATSSRFTPRWIVYLESAEPVPCPPRTPPIAMVVAGIVVPAVALAVFVVVAVVVVVVAGVVVD